MSCGMGCKGSLDPTLLCLQCRPTAAAPFQPLSSLGTIICCMYGLKKKKKKVSLKKSFTFFLKSANVNLHKEIKRTVNGQYVNKAHFPHLKKLLE